MRKPTTLLALAFALPFFLVCDSQAQTDSFAWRSNQPLTTPKIDSQVKQASVESPRIARRLDVPPPPQMKRRPFLVSFRKQNQQAAQESQLVDQQLVDQQPSLSDASNYSFDPPAAPKESESVLEGETQSLQSLSSPEPPLNVTTPEPVEVNYCGRDCRRDWCNLGCEKRLFQPNQCRGTETGGWLSMGYHNRNNILVNNRKDNFALHQLWLFHEKAANRNSYGWDVGYRADLLYGIDAQDLQAFGNSPTGAPTGWDNDWDNGSYGFAAPQLYLQFANVDWDVKIGKFFSPFGYEVIGAPDNFFYSHSFTMYNSEPFTMTGILSERQITPNRSIILGATLGWDTGFENNDGGLIITGTRFQPNEYVNLALTSSLGDTGSRGNGRMTSGVAQLQLTEAVSYVLQADVLNLDTNNEFGIVQYLFREINPCLKLGARLEWWKSDQFFTSTRSTYNFTMGANYRANANITVRPEVRFDWGAAAVDPGQAIIGVDAVMRF